jgi:HlyD family secretion protein
MKTKLKNFLLYVKSHPKRFVLLAILLVLIGLGLSGGNNESVEDVIVSRGALIQEVAVTGKTEPAEEVVLAFEQSGKVSSAPVSVGSRVSAGALLATLDASSQSAEVARARANLAEEEVRLTEIKRQSSGSSNQARASLAASIRDAYTRSDDAIRNTADQFFDNPTEQSTSFNLTIKSGGTTRTFNIDNELRFKLNRERRALEKELVAWKEHLRNLVPSGELESYIIEAEMNLDTVKFFFDDLALAINSISNVDSQYQATVNGFKSDVSASRSAIAIAINNLISAEEVFASAPQGVPGGNGSFDAVLAQEARVAQFQASLQSAQADLAKLSLRSPINGLVTTQDAKVGEIVGANESLIAVISDNNLEIEANVSEVNIGKIQVGNKVSITFDAFLGQTFEGEVVYIDPAETIVDGVVNFKVKINLIGDTTQLKSGLTANVLIRTAEKPDVLSIPLYAVVERDGMHYVQKVVGDGVVETPVSVGFIGNNSAIEILEGLSQGDVVRVGE